MQFKLSNLIGLLAVAGTAVSVNVATSLDGYSALAKDLGDTANSINLLNSFQTGPVRKTGPRSIYKQEKHPLTQARDWSVVTKPWWNPRPTATVSLRMRKHSLPTSSRQLATLSSTYVIRSIDTEEMNRKLMTFSTRLS